ncbi:MAG: DoxX protein [Calditrichia bacterium]
MQERIPQITRLVLGAILLIFGINKFAAFLPNFELQGDALAFMTALVGTGYIMPIVAIVEIAVGAMLVSNKYVPLALLLLAPISVNIVGFHAFLDPANIAPGLIVAAANLVLLFAYKPYYSGALTQDAVANPAAAEKVHA